MCRPSLSRQVRSARTIRLIAEWRQVILLMQIAQLLVRIERVSMQALVRETVDGLLEDLGGAR